MTGLTQLKPYFNYKVFTAKDPFSRFEKKDFMEFQEMAVTRIQNTPENGYGQNQPQPSLKNVFAKFYKVDYFPTQKEFSASFNGSVYLQRIQVTAETFLIEANSRGQEKNKKVYVHMVGLGLGVWMFREEQVKIFLQAFENALKKLHLSWIAYLDFSYVSPLEDVQNLRHDEKFSNTDIIIK